MQIKKEDTKKHYAPKAELILVEGITEHVIEKINELTLALEKEGGKAGVIATDETMALYKTGEVLSLGARADEMALAKHLYRILREFDARGVDRIYSENFKTEGIGQAVADRLQKAAGNQIIHV